MAATPKAEEAAMTRIIRVELCDECPHAAGSRSCRATTWCDEGGILRCRKFTDFPLIQTGVLSSRVVLTGNPPRPSTSTARRATREVWPAAPQPLTSTGGGRR